MNSKELRQWVIEHDAWNKTIEAFWYCFNNYMVEEKDEFTEYFGEFDARKLTLWQKDVRLTARNWDEADKDYWVRLDDEYNENYEFIDMLVVLGYGDKRNIGEYVLRFNVNGDSFDDIFTMEWKNWYSTIEKQVRKERNAEIINILFEQGSDIEEISKVIGLNKEDIKRIREQK